MVNPPFQFFANFKVRQLFRSNLNFGPRAWVPPLVGLVTPHLEGSEIANFDLFPPGQRLRHRAKECIHDGLGVLLRESIRPFQQLLN
jgi:hypothetical protein